MPVRYVDELPATADLVVVGGGIVGAATAFYARRAGLRTLLLERRPGLATLTTAAAAGGFRLQLDAEEEIAMVRESVELFLGFEEATGQREHDSGVLQQGYLWVTKTEQGAARQRSLVESHMSWGLNDVELLSGGEARVRFPFLSPDALQARFRAGDGLVDPKAVTLGLTVGSGADVLVGCGVTGFDTAGDGIAGVRTELGTVSAGNVVVACGPLSGVALASTGVRLPIETVRRHKLVLPDLPEVPRDAPMTIDEDTGAHWRPAFSGATALFTDPTVAPSEPAETVPVDPGFAFQILDPSRPAALARVAPFWADVWRRGSDHWFLQAGQYTMTPDRRPLIGETEIQGLYVNTGYSGHGVMASPGGSRSLVDLITGKADAGENPFRPDRRFAEAHRGVL